MSRVLIKSFGAKILVAFTILFVITVSGCTFIPGIPNPPGTTSGGGVIIVDFNSDFSELYPREKVVFNLKVKNTGSVSAENVFAELLGLDEDWYGGASELFPRESECRWDGDGFTLIPSRPEYSVSGETHICTWEYPAPEGVPIGGSIKYDATARVFYTYYTELIKSITLVSYDKMKEIQQQGGSLPADTVSQTVSPVSISVATKSPIRIQDNDVSFQLEITINNAGGGTVCRKGKCKKKDGEKLNEVTLKIELPGGMRLSDGSGCAKMVTSAGDLVSVWSGKPNTITCEIKTSKPDSETGPEQKAIKVRADYSYFIEKTIPITVNSP
jgi:hypothetical protein